MSCAGRGGSEEHRWKIAYNDSSGGDYNDGSHFLMCFSGRMAELAARYRPVYAHIPGARHRRGIQKRMAPRQELHKERQVHGITGKRGDTKAQRGSGDEKEEQ